MDITDSLITPAKQAAAALHEAAKSFPILGSLSWDDDLRVKFLNDGALPQPVYDPVDVEPALDLVRDARRHITGTHPVMSWLASLSDDIETTAHMVATRGTPEFGAHSAELYGQPTKTLLDKKTRVIDMARHIDASLDELSFDHLVIEGVEQDLTALEFQAKLTPHLTAFFGEAAPDIEISKTLSAKALAGSTRIRLRESAIFSNRDVEQLLQHEAYVHAATSLNGRAQDHFPLLGRSHARVTEIQEGLAVFAEMMSGAMDPSRFRRLADRVLAIQMSLDGADFKEVYDFYHARIDNPDQAFENTRRVFRGGVMTGGAPFTKDMVYLNGLLRVHNFMRTVVKLRRADLIRLLFVGKLDLEDVPALAGLANAGYLAPPKFMPPWVADLRFLVSYLSYSGFLNRVQMPGFQTYYAKALEDVPEIWGFVG